MIEINEIISSYVQVEHQPAYNGEARRFDIIMVFKKDDAKFDVATVTLLRFSIEAILWLIKVTLYFVAVILFIASFYSFSEKMFIPFNLSCLLMSFVPFVLARIVRMAQFEIEHIKDRNYLIGILSSIAAFIAMILAIIALLV